MVQYVTRVSKGLTELSGSVLFRVDASNKIGSGHIMRCLTLANETLLRGRKSIFVMRDPEIQIINKVKSSGHELHLLVDEDKSIAYRMDELAHSNWLSVSQETDAIETTRVIQEVNPEWVVADHYALDAQWHSIVKKTGKKLLVIDDIADRVIDCDILLNQNVGFSEKDYIEKIKADTKIFLGPKYALIRPEFLQWREFSLNRRKTPDNKRVLITMGGVDAQNQTLNVLQILEPSINAAKCEFVVVLGELYPFLDELNKFVAVSSNKITNLVNVNNIAELMASSDICIGATGSSAWERCCLGLPTLTIAIAENQKRIAASLNEIGVAVRTERKRLKTDFDILFEAGGSNALTDIVKKSSELCDGLGALRILEYLE